MRRWTKKRRCDRNRGQIEDIHTVVEKKTFKLPPQITDVCSKTSFLPAQMWDVHMWIKAEERMELKKKAYFL